MKIYCLKNVALLARKRQHMIDLMSNILLEAVVGEPLQEQVPELHRSGAPELTHGVYSGSCCAIFSFCVVVVLSSRFWVLSFFDLRFSVVPWYLKTFLPDPIQ